MADANTTTIDNFDALSRVTQFTNPLGVFTQTYDPVNLMPETLTAPNGLTTTLDYHPAAADLRLKEKALARVAAPTSQPGRYRPDDTLLAFLESL